VEVPIRNEYENVPPRVGSQGEDSCDSGLHSDKHAVMVCSKALFDANAVGKCEERGNEVIRVGDRVDIDGVVVSRGVVCKVNDDCSVRLCHRSGQSTDDLGV